MELKLIKATHWSIFWLLVSIVLQLLHFFTNSAKMPVCVTKGWGHRASLILFSGSEAWKFGNHCCTVFPSCRTYKSVHLAATDNLNPHSAFCFHRCKAPSLHPPSFSKSSFRWTVSRLMADLRYTTCTRPFTSTSCWPFSRGSMKNSPLSVRIRPAWKNRTLYQIDSLPWN